jgi:uncharacterized membrane protein
MLIPFPFAYLFGSAALDLFARATGRRRWHQTARELNTLGLASAVVAAVPGLIDYLFAVPPRSSAHRRATFHMLANVSALAMFASARAGRGAYDERPAGWALAAQAAGAALLSGHARLPQPDRRRSPLRRCRQVAGRRHPGTRRR